MEQVRTLLMVFCNNGKANLDPIGIGIRQVNPLGFDLLEDMFDIVFPVWVELWDWCSLGLGKIGFKYRNGFVGDECVRVKTHEPQTAHVFASRVHNDVITVCQAFL